MSINRCVRNKTIFAGTLLCAAGSLAGRSAAQTLTTPIILPSSAATPGPTFPARPNPGAVTVMPGQPSSKHPPIVLASGSSAKKTIAGANTSGAARRTAAAAEGVPANAPAASAATNVHATLSAMAFANGADFDAPLPAEKMLHLVLGHSVFIDTKHRLSRVYITNPDVLSSYTSNPNQVVITAKQTGLSTLIVWDEVGDTQVYMVSSEMDVAGLSSALKKAFPTEEIAVTTVDGRITISGTVGTQVVSDAAGKLAALYAKDVSNTLFVSSSKIKQVRLKVRFAEVDRSRITQLGFNIFGIINSSGNPTLVQSTTGAFASGPQINTGSTSGGAGASGRTISVSNALNYFIYDFQHQIGATIQDLENRNILHILAEPSITAMSGEKANFLAGGEFPFPVVQGGTAGSVAAVSIVFKPYGVKLDFTPVVNADGTIDLTVAPEVSALDYSNAVSLGGYTVPALSTRRASTQVVLRDGQSFAISGLLDQRTTDAFAKTPGIASVPVLGALFHSKNVNHSNTELIVIVTPEIVDPLNDKPEEITPPASPIPLMNQKKFDDKLPKMEKKPTAVD